MFPILSSLFARKTFTTRNGRPIRKRKPTTARVRLELTGLEDRVVPAGPIGPAGFSLVEQQQAVFPLPPGAEKTVIELPKAFNDQLDQTWLDILSGTERIQGKTFNQTVQDAITKAVHDSDKDHKENPIGAYNIKTAMDTPFSNWKFQTLGQYSARLDTSGANPVLALQYKVDLLYVEFTTTTHSVFGSGVDPTFKVYFGLTLNVNLFFPSGLSSGSELAVSASAVTSQQQVSSGNIFVGEDDLRKIGDSFNTTTELSDNLKTKLQTVNAGLRGEALKGYTHLHAGLDETGKLLKLTMQKPDLVVNGSANGNIYVGVAGQSWPSIFGPGRNGSVQVIAAGQFASFDPDYLRSITIKTGSGQNTVNILGVPVGVAVNVIGAANSNDSVRVGSGSLANVAGPVNVSNNSGKTTLTIDDSADRYAHDVTVTNDAVQFSWFNRVTYSGGVTALNVYGPSTYDGFFPNSFFVRSTSHGTPLTLFTGARQNTIWVGDHGSLAGIQAPVDVRAASDQTWLIIDDYSETGRNAVLSTYHEVHGWLFMQRGSVAFTGVPAITYSGVNALSVVGASGNNTIQVDNVAPATHVTIYNGKYNRVTGPATWLVAYNYFRPDWDPPESHGSAIGHWW